MKRPILLIGLFLFTVATFSQRYITKNGHISFYSETPMETIEAHNHQVNSALDIASGDFVFKVLMKSFEFEKALMQEHFNENYVESDQFPNATFKGKVLNVESHNFKNDGTFNVEIEGDLTIHGVTKKVKEKGTFDLEDGILEGTSTIVIKLADYDIKIPKAVMGSIEEEIEINVKVKLEEYQK